jgi:hypothetical protein
MSRIKIEVLLLLYPAYLVYPVTSLLFYGAWACGDAFHARLIDDFYLEVINDVHLAGKPHVLGQAGLGSEACALKLAYFAGVSRQHLYAASSTFGIAAAAVQNVNARVFDCQHELAPLRRLKTSQTRSSLCFNLRHDALSLLKNF